MLSSSKGAHFCIVVDPFILTESVQDKFHSFCARGTKSPSCANSHLAAAEMQCQSCNIVNPGAVLNFCISAL